VSLRALAGTAAVPSIGALMCSPRTRWFALPRAIPLIAALDGPPR